MAPARTTPEASSLLGGEVKSSPPDRETVRRENSAAPDAGEAVEQFHKGVAISVFQNSGGANCNWGEFCRLRGKLFGLYPNIMDRSDPSVSSPDFWNRYKEDIKLAKDLNVNAFRLSIEWHRIETSPHVYDMDAVRRYHQIIDEVIAQGMIPNATLHHFTHPLWWHKLGGFEKHANVGAFVDFCVFCAREFGQKIKLWATFNEPTCYLVCGYLIGAHPPGKLLHMCQMGHVLLNILRAHAAAYKAMKAVSGCEDLQVGMVHHHVEFMPTSDKWWWIKPLAWWGTFWWGRDTVLNFLQTGSFEWHVPLWGRTIKYQQTEKPGLDWWGVNYYTRGTISAFCLPAKMPGEIMTDMKYPLYPAGLYHNIVRGAALGVPMYVTEIGCADASADDDIRKINIETSMQQISRAVKDGYDVRGVYYWTLIDNFEWNTGYTMKFGIYAWDKDDPAKRHKLKDGGRLLARIYKAWPLGLEDLRAFCRRDAQHPPEYEVQLEEKQRGYKVLPVVYTRGGCRSVQPLSQPHLAIGIDAAALAGQTPQPEDAKPVPASGLPRKQLQTA